MCQAHQKTSCLDEDILLLIPAFSVIDVKKAITSCLTFSSIFKILLTFIFAFELTFLVTPFGILT